MPYKRFDDLEAVKKQKIIDEALKVFSENRFKSASINGISKAAGLSAGALYYYFENKNDLFYTVLDDVSKQLWEHVGDLEKDFDESGYWETIRVMVLKRIQFSFKHPLFMKLFNRVLMSEDVDEIKGRNRLMSGFLTIFDYGYDHGYIRQDLPKDFLFTMHFNMTLTINKWTLKKFEMVDKGSVEKDELERISIKAVDMIKSAMTL